MYTKNLTLRELYSSISSTSFIVELFQKGLEMNNDRLAVSAMEELLRRGDSDLITEALDSAFDHNQLTPESTTVRLIGCSLADSAREVDPILQMYGKGLLRGDFVGPHEWVSEHADMFRRVYKSGVVRNARPWASAQIWDNSSEDD